MRWDFSPRATATQPPKTTNPTRPQDIAIVPFLVLLPLIESNGGMDLATPTTLMQSLGPTALNSAAGLGFLLLGGRFVLRRIYEVRAGLLGSTFSGRRELVGSRGC
jgi:hypothetical protein